MVEETILRAINAHNLIEENQHIVIGLSGGPDSVCLFHVLTKLSEKMNLTLHPVHVNHQIRPGDAEHDQHYVEALCRGLGMEPRVVVFDCNRMAAEEGITSEEAGRKVRYEAFDEEARAVVESGVPQDMVRIAVAHNADDQTETILFRLLRGTGTDGLAGMEYSRSDEKGFIIIRPMLDVWKKDILEYCREQKLDPCMDYTNAQAVYARNRIRLELIPYLEKYNPGVKDAVVRLGKVAAMDREYLEGEAEAALREMTKHKTAAEVLLDGERLRELGAPVRRRALAMALKSIGLTEDVGFVHFEEADELVFSDKPSARLDLPHGYYLTRVYSDVRAALDDHGRQAGAEMRTAVMGIEEYRRQARNKGTFAAFDADALADAYGEGFERLVQCRNRSQGDYLAIAGGKKKLQDLFVDAKVPKDKRDDISFAAIGREVLFLPAAEGLLPRGRYSAGYIIDAGTKRVFIVEIFR
jgi:tRNA(Ile)-lysidine synthase